MWRCEVVRQRLIDGTNPATYTPSDKRFKNCFHHALRGLKSLTRAAENKREMWSNQTVREAFISGWKDFQSEDIQAVGIRGLKNLADSAENQVEMWKNQGVRNALICAATADFYVREHALEGLSHLA